MRSVPCAVAASSTRDLAVAGGPVAGQQRGFCHSRCRLGAHAALCPAHGGKGGLGESLTPGGTLAPHLDVLALALGAEFRDVDWAAAMARLDALGTELSRAAGLTSRTPEAPVLACRDLLGVEHRFVGDRDHYDDPAKPRAIQARLN